MEETLNSEDPEQLHVEPAGPYIQWEECAFKEPSESPLSRRIVGPGLTSKAIALTGDLSGAIKWEGGHRLECSKVASLGLECSEVASWPQAMKGEVS